MVMSFLASSRMLSSVLYMEGKTLPTIIISKEMQVQQNTLKKIILLSASFASLGLPAPRSWPTTMEIHPPS